MTSIEMMMKALEIGKIKNDDEKADAMKALLKEYQESQKELGRLTVPPYQERKRYFTPEEAKAAIEATAAAARRFAGLIAEAENPYLRDVLAHAVKHLSQVAIMLDQGGGAWFHGVVGQI